MQRTHLRVVPDVHLALGDDEGVRDLVVPVPAGQVERGPTVLSLLVDVAFHGDEDADDALVSVERRAVERIGAGPVLDVDEAPAVSDESVECGYVPVPASPVERGPSILR